MHFIRTYSKYGERSCIKTAFNYYLYKLYSLYKGVITVSGNDEHLIQDINRVKNKSYKNGLSFVLGIRDFYNKNVLFSTYLFNIIYCNVFSLFVGGNIKDTRTSLRVIPNDVLFHIINIKGERYELKLII